MLVLDNLEKSRNGLHSSKKFGYTSVTLPDKIVNDREENPAVSKPAVCKGHPHMLTSSVVDLYNVHREFNSKSSYVSVSNSLASINLKSNKPQNLTVPPDGEKRKGLEFLTRFHHFG